MSEPLRALVVDDEPAARQAIRALLADDPTISVVGECADGRSALDAIRAHAPDLVFLDVQMPELDGFAVLRGLDPAELPAVVFTTAYDQYALRAFEVHAVDYVLKPFDDERFRRAVAHAREQVRRGRLDALSSRLAALLQGTAPRSGASASEAGRSRRLVIKSAGRVTLLEMDDVDWVEADGDHVKVHTAGTWHLLRGTMKELESQLDPERFVRLHRSTIVNVARIRELQPYFRGEYVVVLHDGTKLKLSRAQKPRLEAALGRAF